MYNDKNILITGGTGTFGNAFVLNALEKDLFNKIIIYSRDEYKQFYMRKKFEEKFPEKSKRLRFFLGDIRDKDRLLLALNNVHFVVAAAAIKQVKAIEYNPIESVKTNILGNINTIDASIEKNVENVVFLSSDKSVAAETIYGNNKMAAEKYAVFANSFATNTKICACRYGNIQNSRGSVIELFLKNKISPFTITDSRMTRFFMSIQEAVNLVLHCLQNTQGGEVFIQKAKACNIERLAKTIDPKRIIKYTGISFTEKLHERLVSEMEMYRLATSNKYFVVLPENPQWDTHLRACYANKMVEMDEKEFISGTTEQFTDGELLQMIANEINRIKFEE